MNKNLHYIQFQTGGHWEEHIEFLFSDPIPYNVNPVLIVNDSLDVTSLNLSNKVEIKLISQKDCNKVLKGIKIKRFVHEFFLIKKIVKKYSIEDLYYDSLDQIYFISGLGFKIGCNVSGILYKLNIDYDEELGNLKKKFRFAFKNFFLKRLLSNKDIKNLYSLDELAVSHFEAEKIKYLPDVCNFDPDIKGEYQGVSSSKSIKQFTMFGAISKRKGVINILKAISVLPPINRNQFRFLIAGKVKKDEKDEINLFVKKIKEQFFIDILIDDRFLDKSELNELVRKSDLIFMPYVNFTGSSGVLLWASGAKKLVVAQKNGQIGRYLKKYALGYAVDPNSVTEIKDAMLSYLTEDAKYQEIKEKSRFEEFIEGRSPDLFKKKIYKTIFLN